MPRLHIIFYDYNFFDLSAQYIQLGMVDLTHVHNHMQGYLLTSQAPLENPREH